jgi:SAM-dependent methyltransferase
MVREFYATPERAVRYIQTDWQQSLERAKSAHWKQIAYHAARPLLDRFARASLDPALLAELRPDIVLGQRGFTNEARMRWGLAGLDLRRTTLLVQGTGTGWDTWLWASLRPARIIAVDAFEFDTWGDVARECKTLFGVDVQFRCAELECVDQVVPAGTIDAAVSQAVFEHCRHLPEVLATTHRVLKPRGRLYATYGPLWFSPSGDHFSPRGAGASIYSHVELSPEEYAEYFARERYEVEDFQQGGRFVELDLFSKLTTRQYLAAFEAAGFVRTGLALEVCPNGINFRRRSPDRWRHLVARVEAMGGTADDLLIKSNGVRLERRELLQQ